MLDAESMKEFQSNYQTKFKVDYAHNVKEICLKARVLQGHIRDVLKYICHEIIQIFFQIVRSKKRNSKNRKNINIYTLGDFPRPK